MSARLKILFIVSHLLLIIGGILKLLVMPNQLIAVSTTLILYLLVILPAFAWLNIKNNKGLIYKLTAVAIVLLLLFVMVSLYMGVLGQGLVPLLIWLTLFGTIALYLVIRYKRAQELRPVLRSYILNFGIGIILLFINAPFEQTIPDKLYDPIITNPSYELDYGTTIYIDEGHCNYHTLNGRYLTFSRILKKDGYRVKAFNSAFNSENLKKIKILVISNAVHKKNQYNWSNPTYSAFTTEEIDAVEAWVSNGGALLLIADHMPFAGAAKDLAKAFGFKFSNGHAGDTINQADIFYRSATTLQSNIITNGRGDEEKVDSIRTFSGQAFQIPEDATSILTFGSEYVQWIPERAWDLKSCTPKSIEGWSQGASMKYGKGRIAVFGEAAMFTGQYGAGLSWMKVGLNQPDAHNNYKLLLNIVRWLDGII